VSIVAFPNNPNGIAAVAAISGSGDNLSYSGAVTTGQFLTAYAGTQAAPDTTLNPLGKFNRTFALTSVAVAGDGAEQASAGGGITTGTTGNQVQAVGWYGISSNAGTAKGATLSPDACGIYGVGRILAGGIGVGMGGYFRGMSNSSTGLISAIQAEAYNNRGVNDAPTETGFPNSSALWIWASGPNSSAQAITIGNPFGVQFDTGIMLNAQVNGALTGGVSNTGIRLAGIYAKAALSVAQGSPVVLGGIQTGFAGAALDCVNSGIADPIAVFRSSASSNVSIQVQNSVGSSTYFAAGGAGAKLTGTAAGDTGIKVNTATKTYHIGGTVSTIKVTQANTLAFFNAAAVAQPAAYTLNAGATSRNLPAGATLVQVEAFVRQVAADLSASNGGNGLVA
jgi:hypothetical protein